MMDSLRTTDNSKLPLSEEDQVAHLDNLRSMAALTLKDWCEKENGSLLIYPHSFEVNKDGIEKERIFDVHGNNLETGNIMGFVGRGLTKVSIRSRFAEKDAPDYFLHYMLQKVFAINLFDLKHHADEENIFDFLIYLFPSFLKRAVRQGLFREYQTRRYNDANVRGRIDVSRHIRENIPFRGTVAYTTRTYSANNAVTQLVRHAVEYIDHHPLACNILRNDDETKAAVHLIREATPTYNRHERHRILNANLRPLRHPYFNEYKSLQRLCMQILRHKGMKYGAKEEEIYGILFDGAWLWEEYLNTFLHPLLRHPQNRTGKGKKFLFTNHSGSYIPDFYNKVVVLDAKYKKYGDKNFPQREDRFQIITYMYMLSLKKGGFIVPVAANEQRTLTGDKGTVSVLGMTVQHDACADYTDFCRRMEVEETRLFDSIEKLIKT